MTITTADLAIQSRELGLDLLGGREARRGGGSWTQMGCGGFWT